MPRRGGFPGCHGGGRWRGSWPPGAVAAPNSHGPDRTEILPQTALETQPAAGAPDAPDATRQAVRLGLLALAGLTLARLALAAVVPLYETEAYYWLWSRNLAAGYFDHPPMTGWVAWAFGLFDAPSSLSARLHTVLFHAATTIMLYQLGRNLSGSRRVGLHAAGIFQAALFYNAIAVQHQPDSPLLLFWTATVLCFERALNTERRRWWILAGVCAGGAFLSKFHGFFFVGCILLSLVASRVDRRWLATPWPWLALLAALAVYSPNFFWNAANGWITYDFQLLRHGEESEFQFENVLMTLAAPVAFLGPWLYGLGLWMMWRAARSGRFVSERSMAVLFWTTAPLVVFFLALSFRQMIKVHWPAPAWVLVCPLAAMEVARWSRKVQWRFYASTAAFSIGLYAWMAFAGPVRTVLPDAWFPPVEIGPQHDERVKDWTLHTTGWREFGAFLDELMAELEEEHDAPVLLASRRFDRAAAAAFFAGRPESAFIPDPLEPYSQRGADFDPRGFLLWDAPLAVPEATVILLFFDRDMRSWDDRDRRLFGQVFGPFGEREQFVVERRGRPIREFHYAIARGIRPEGLPRRPWTDIPE